MPDRKSNDRSLGAQLTGFVSGLIRGREDPEISPTESEETPMLLTGGVGGRPERVLAAGDKGDELRRALVPLLDDDGGALGANLQVLGLNSLKEKVGDQWPRFKKVIHTVVESTLGKALTTRDRYMRLDDETYVIAFDDTDAVSTAQRTGEIGAAIVKQLLGTESGASVSVKVLGGRIDVNSAGEVIFTEGRKRPHAPKGASSQGAADEMATDVRWASRAKTILSASGANELDDLLKEAADAHARRLRDSKIGVSDVDEALRDAAEVHRRRTDVDYSIGFGPIWDVKKKAVTSYAVIPYYSEKTSWRLGYEVLGDRPSLDDVLELDVACLRIAIAEIAKSYKSNQAVIIIPQVHYRSLLSKGGLSVILSECARLPEFLRKYVAIQVVGLPAELSIGAATNAVAMLHGYVRVISARVGPEAAASRIKQLGFDIVCLPQPQAEFSLTDRERVLKWMAGAHAQGLPTVVEFISARAVAAELAELGVAYMSGRFIGLPLKAPEGLIWCDLDNFPLKPPRDPEVRPLAG